ncbi:hypothetical protein QQS21_005051 [Conoideocrella luteorostrata]|uniref:Nucleoside phosphorylase domain-containing protein n=1 Tax=Conoideocrella luteorostrata TaxID=1105319 RepID=A0AAJ0FZE0_9HYPO|nr:hypothetical protein QQS21_005051 [Conoideocrella luteorostrata]
MSEALLPPHCANGTDSTEEPDRNKRRKLNDNVDDSTAAYHHHEDQDGNRPNSNDYTIVWISALPIEMAAAEVALDRKHPDLLQQHPNDGNAYLLGSLGKHNVVLACLPSNRPGTNNAAIVASNVHLTFQHIRIWLMVGVGGGVPTRVDVRLGDVVVGEAIWQCDFGKIRLGGLDRTRVSCDPLPELMTTVGMLRARHEIGRGVFSNILSGMLQQCSASPLFTKPDSAQDFLFDSEYEHQGPDGICDRCEKSRLVDRPDRETSTPYVHHGVIASSNQLMRDARTRDQLAHSHGVLCFEMEAAGLGDSFRCMAIRGISDYADSHKSKLWQRYAAMSAAAYAKELVLALPVRAPQIVIPPNLKPVISVIEPMLERRTKLLDTIGFEQMKFRYETIRPAYAKTCKWLLNCSKYLEWLKANDHVLHHRLLWINGKPGAGKSTLMKFAYTQAEQQLGSTVTLLYFFFHARGDLLERSTLGMHRSLLHQLLDAQPDLQSVLDDTSVGARHRPWTMDELRITFNKAVARLKGRRLVCYIDALDECDEDQVRDMVAYFKEVVQHAFEAGDILQICFSSRHYPFMNIPQDRKIILEDQIGHADDLKKYIDNKLASDPALYTLEVKDEIIRKAQGVFMWIVLVVDILNREIWRGRAFAVRKRLAEIPGELADLFKDILTRDEENIADMRVCIQWILFANRPLRRDEFYYAVLSGIVDEQDELEKCRPDNISEETIDRFVLSSSKGLAEVTKTKKKTVQFIHESVRDYLIRDRGYLDLWPDAGDFSILSHDLLKRCCHMYLKQYKPAPSMTVLRDTPNVDAKARRDFETKYLPFLDYAARHLLYHANEAGTHVDQKNFLETDFDLAHWIKAHNLIEKHMTRRYSSDVQLTYILADHNCIQLLRATGCREAYASTGGGARFSYPILAALYHDHREAVEILLQFEKRKCDFRDTSFHLHKAVATAPPHLVQKLLQFEDVDPNCRDNSGESALDIAMRRKNLEIALTLLRHEKLVLGLKELELFSKLGDEPTLDLLLKQRCHGLIHNETQKPPLLIQAVLGRYNYALRRLLEVPDVNTNITDSSGRIALSHAIETRNEYAALLLLERDLVTPDVSGNKAGKLNEPLLQLENFNTKSMQMFGESILHWAAKVGHEEILRLLLRFSRQKVNARDKHGNTPLSLAATGGHYNVVELLLAQSDVDVNCRNHLGESALFQAAHAGYPAVASRLLSVKGVDPLAKDKYGTSPMEVASSKNLDVVVQALHDASSKSDDLTTSMRYEPKLAQAIESRDRPAIEAMIQAGSDVNAVDSNGTTLLVLAIENGDVDTTKRLLQSNNIDVNAPSGPQKRTALHYAIMLGRDDVVGLLLARASTKINTKDAEDCSPLHLAIQCNDMNIVCQLLERTDVNPYGLTKGGLTPWSYACELGYIDIAEVIMAHMDKARDEPKQYSDNWPDMEDDFDSDDEF